MLRKFQVAPPAEPDPDDIQPGDLHYRCIVCGAEVTMTAAQEDEPGGAPALPRGHGAGRRRPEAVLPRLWRNLCEVTRLGFGHSPQ